MSVSRLTRVDVLLKRAIAEALFRIMNEGGFDLSAVTITKAKSSPNLRHADIFVSIRGNEEARKTMFKQLKAHRVQIQSILNKDLVLKYTPVLRFVSDDSTEKGDKILNILINMEHHDATKAQSDEQ